MKFFVQTLVLLVTSVAAKSPDRVYDVALDGEARHTLFWALDYVNSKIKFEVHAELQEGDWFAVGFSDRGDFENGDYCVYVPTNRGPQIQGVWTDDKCIAHSFLGEDDICSNFRIVKGKTTKFTFTRPFEKCSDHHYQIEDGTTHIVWSRGSGTLIGRSLCRRQEDGMTRVQLLKTEGMAAPHPPATWVYTPTVKDLKVPSSDTTYWCQTVELPSRLHRRHHVIQAESYLTKGNEGLVHHMEFFHCKVPYGTQIPYYSGLCDKKPASLLPCAKVIAAWAMGATPFVYPEEAGLPVGGPNYTLYAMLEIHYNNPMKLANWVDSSGFKIYMTPDLREHDAGIVELGLEYVDKMAIPPGQKLFSLSGYCISECLNVALPERGIMMFGAQLHTHLTGVMTETRHIRQGVELERLNYDYHYSPHFQEIRLLKKQRKILPGDALIQTCYYNTIGRENITLGGFKTTDEMCVSYVYYYPKIDLEVCKSSISDDALEQYFNALSALEYQHTGGGLPISESYGRLNGIR
uniref:Tyramine beta-hydroxylase n=1 Tax=Lygus hesperus TaxID=30085 RepID=A0A0A9WPA7_LYGHE